MTRARLALLCGAFLAAGILIGLSIRGAHEERRESRTVDLSPGPPEGTDPGGTESPLGAPPIIPGAGIIELRCDVHPWMEAYVAFSNHPFITITREGGRYSMESLPPGKHTVAAWHEKYGTKTTEVVVSAAGIVEANFRFAAN